MDSPGVLMVVSGPSGSGKTSLCKALLEREPEARFSVSYTTRSKRAGEHEGKDYHFVDQPTFRRMIEQKQFAEWAEVYGQLYGTSAAWLRSQMDLGIDVILDIDYQGAYQVRDRLDDDSPVLVFVIPPSFEVLKERLASRGTETDARVRERLQTAEEELRHVYLYDYVVINDAFDRAVTDLAAILHAERNARARLLPRVRRSYGALIPSTPPPPPKRRG
ncbi:MAG: guanylate kinase [Deltaproteobacteria bacterium]|nr:guanylate kinase [Deltaproteobacteria bacterium]